MEHPNISVRRTGTKYGFFTGLVYILYFLLLAVTNLIRVVELHFLAGLILVVGVVVAISRFKAARNGMIEYFQGLGLGLTVGLIASLLYAVVQVIGDYLFNMIFTAPYRSGDFFHSDLAIWMHVFAWIIFGIIIGTLTAFIAMQWFKRPSHQTKDI
jgi:hypothetical protein